MKFLYDDIIGDVLMASVLGACMVFAAYFYGLDVRMDRELKARAHADYCISAGHSETLCDNTLCTPKKAGSHE
jgi:hypothetical protein